MPVDEYDDYDEDAMSDTGAAGTSTPYDDSGMTDTDAYTDAYADAYTGAYADKSSATPSVTDVQLAVMHEHAAIRRRADRIIRFNALNA